MALGLDNVIVAAWIGLLIVWVIGGFMTKTTVRKQSTASRLLEIVPMALVFMLFFSSRTLADWTSMQFVPDTLAWRSLGTAMTVAGAALAIWARFYLGRNWSATVTVKQEHELIRTGPYRVVRHPIYSGLLLALLGTAIYGGQVKGLIAVAVAMIVWKMKSLREESFMQSEFGEQYAQYRREVKGLVPFIW